MSSMSAQSEINRARILPAAILAVALSIGANLLTLFVLKALLSLPAEFPPLTPGAVAFFTLLGTSMGSLVFALVVRLSARPLVTFQRIAWAALVLSIIPNLGLMANPAAAPFPGGSALAFGVLIVFHVIAGVITIFVLTRISQR